MSNESSWKSLEKRVREIASYIWNAPAEPEELHGVKVDAVLKLEDDRWVFSRSHGEPELGEIKK